MRTVGLEGVTVDELNEELERGAKFVIFEYCVSIVFMTFRRGSDIYFIRSGESRAVRGLPYTLLSLVAGWWGIPWGPIFTIGSVLTNLAGGKDVTGEVVAGLSQCVQDEEEPLEKSEVA
ncbi:MAG: hypothetical protein JXA69_19850 [Phycisphaerae bacterium]|nr:hypothetical protein [Phycisphaerae bacterium]